MHIFYDCYELRDLHQTPICKRYVKPAVVDDFGAMKFSFPWHWPTKILLGSARSHTLLQWLAIYDR